jgi:hypothetical protein
MAIIIFRQPPSRFIPYVLLPASRSCLLMKSGGEGREIQIDLGGCRNTPAGFEQSFAAAMLEEGKDQSDIGRMLFERYGLTRGQLASSLRHSHPGSKPREGPPNGWLPVARAITGAVARR